MKGQHFVGASLADLRRFPAEAPREVGFQFDAVQRGLDPTGWKLLSAVGVGVIRIHVLGEAPRRLGIRQSLVSDLVRGKWEKSSLEARLNAVRVAFLAGE